MKISGVYKITNLETNDCYVGSSINIKKRWTEHKAPSIWKRCPNNKLYIDLQQYGLDKFKFEIVEETTKLKEREQYYIDLLKPIYNNNRADGKDLERYKERDREYHKEHYEKDKKECMKKYDNQLCNYNGETITFAALKTRFRRKGIQHSTLEAKKFLIK